MSLLPLVFGLYCLSLISTLSGMEIFSGILTLAWLVSILRNRQGEFPLWKPIGCFALVVILGIFFGNSSTSDKLSDISRLRFFLFFWASLYFLKRIENKRWIIPLALGCTVIGLYGILQHFYGIDWVRPAGKKIILYSDGGSHGPLVLGFFNHHLTFSNIFLLYAPLFLSFGFYKFPKNIFYWLLSLLLYVCILWTDSRAAWVAIPVTVLVIAIGKSWRWQGPVIALVATIACLAFFYGSNENVRNRFSKTFELSDPHSSLTPRLKIWRVQWEQFKTSPLWGIGWNNNERSAKSHLDRLYPFDTNMGGHAHSMVLQIMSTTGILGLISFFWIWFGVFSQLKQFLSAPFANQESRWVALGLTGSFVGFWIQGATQWNFGDAEVLHNIMFLWGVAFSLSKSHQPSAG